MDLVVYQVVQLQIMHVSDGNGAVEELAGPPVAQAHLTVAADGHTLPELAVFQVGTQIIHHLGLDQVFIFCLKFLPGKVHVIVGQFQGILNVVLVCAVEDRGGHVEAQGLGSKA